MADAPPLKILSLDRGGVRGIATLYLLRGLMDQIALSINQPAGSLRPCNYFDLIAGTSTGGLIAIILGRLRYTADEAIEKYTTLAKDIFSVSSSNTDAKFDHRILEKKIKEVVTKAPFPRPETLTADAVFRDETVDVPHNKRIENGKPLAGCRIFVVCNIPGGSGHRAKIFRSYQSSSKHPFSGKIWEAARATSAAPTFFAPIIIDCVTYTDGGTGWNNPTELVIGEVPKIWKDRPIDCLISLGTGENGLNQLVRADNLLQRGGKLRKLFSLVMPKLSFKLEVASYCAECLTDCTRTHEKLLGNLKRDHLVDSYFRLNTPVVGNIKLEGWKRIGEMINRTVNYLDAPETEDKIDKIVSKFKSYHDQLVVTNTPIQSEAGISDDPQGSVGP